MADHALVRRQPVDTVPLRASAEFLSARILPPLGRFSFRGDTDAAALCGGAFGTDLPAEANRVRRSGERAALWLGPDEWLLLCPEAEGVALSARLTEAATKLPCSLVDISHRQTAVEISGTHAAALLNAGVMLDLDERAFPVDAATRTIFAKTEIVLWRKASDVFHVEVWRSFAPYFTGLLIEASRCLPGAGG